MKSPALLSTRPFWRDVGATTLLVAAAMGGAWAVQKAHFASARAEEAALLRFDHQLGATVEPLTDEIVEALSIAGGEQGLVVTSLSDHGPSARPPVQVGDVIERIDGTSVQTVSDAAEALRNARGAVQLDVNRNGQEFEAWVTLR